MRGGWPSGGGCEFGVVGAAAVLRFGPDGVVAGAAPPVVVHLEVAGGFGEAVLVLGVVNEVVPIGEVGHGS